MLAALLTLRIAMYVLLAPFSKLYIHFTYSNTQQQVNPVEQEVKSLEDGICYSYFSDVQISCTSGESIKPNMSKNHKYVSHKSIPVFHSSGPVHTTSSPSWYC